MRNKIARILRSLLYLRLYDKHKTYTMAPRSIFWRNLLIFNDIRHIKGCVIECGVWRGGISAGIAEVLVPDREYFLFDSFEGLPLPTTEDGEAAMAWQQNITSPMYHDNCCAPIEFAKQAMCLSQANKYYILKGWFKETVNAFIPPSPIAILRLDADWYESTLVVLAALYKYMASDGIIIIDDYYAWDGCSRAVHDFLSRHQSTARLTKKHGCCVIELRR